MKTNISRLNLLLAFINADSFKEQVTCFRQITNACESGTQEFLEEQGWTNRSNTITIEELVKYKDNDSIHYFLVFYYDCVDYLNPDNLYYLYNEYVWEEYALSKAKALDARIEGKRRAFLHRQARKCSYEDAAYYHMLHYNLSLDQFVKYINDVKSIVNKFINSSTTGELMNTYHELYSGRERKNWLLNDLNVTIYGDVNYNGIPLIVGEWINKEIESRLKTFNFNEIPFDELQKVLRYSDVSLIKILCHVNIVDWNDAYKWASVLRPQIKSYMDDKLSVRVSTFTLGDVWK